jgi:hypothetical protein
MMPLHKERLSRAVELVGQELFTRNPMVYTALTTISHGADVETALACCVRGLAAQNERMLKDLVAIASNRPMAMPAPPEKKTE